MDRAIALFVALGVIVRSVRYLLRFPLWKDEAFLAVNFIDARFADLLEPLHPHQVAPVLYLLGQLAVTKLLGFNEYSLRALSFISGIAALLLFPYVASRLLRGTALVLAVALFAVDYPMVRFSSEAKPYALDVLVAVGLLALVVRWLQNPAERRWLWALAGCAPVAAGLSYPSIFILAGLSAVVAAVSWGARRNDAWLPWGAFNLASLAGFAASFALVAGRQSAQELAYMRADWQAAFPPLDSVIDLAVWFVRIHIGDLLAHPAGRGHTGGLAMFVVCLAAVWALLRSRHFLFLLLCAAPFAMNLIAAALQRYPYGEEIRVALYLAPFVCLAGGVGLAAIERWIRRGRPATRTPGLFFVALFFALGVSSIGKDFVEPYKSRSDATMRDFARSFWAEAEREGEVVALDSDCGLSFSDEAEQELSSLFIYRCNRRIYSPRHAAGEAVRLESLSAERPVRFIHYVSGELAYDALAYRRWQVDMKASCVSLRKESHAFERYDYKKGDPIDYVEVWTCVPRGPGEASAFGCRSGEPGPSELVP